MANDFKRYTKANVTTSTGTSSDAVYTVPSTGGTAMETVVIGIYLSNTGTTGITADVFVDAYDGSSYDIYVVKSATVPAGSTLEVISGGKLVVQGNGTTNDAVRISSSTASSLDATISVLEDV